MKNKIFAKELIKMQQHDLATRTGLLEKSELFDSKHQYNPIMKKVHPFSVSSVANYAVMQQSP